MKTEDQLLQELKALLKKYKAEIIVENNWQGYPECGEEIRMVVQFDDFTLEELPLGKWIDGEGNG